MKKNWASSHCFGGTMIRSVDLFSGSGSGSTPNGNDTCSSDPGGTGGQMGSSDSGCDGIVYIDPSIWSDPNPEISCEPPCTFILPPISLPTPTTITFPPLVTSLDVAWSASTGWTHIVQNTTLSIPPRHNNAHIHVGIYGLIILHSHHDPEANVASIVVVHDSRCDDVLPDEQRSTSTLCHLGRSQPSQ